MEHWYLACHKKGKHNAYKAQMFLSRMGVDVFIPQICIRQLRADRHGHFRDKIELLFPGYMFVNFNYEEKSISKVASCPGMSHFVRFSGMIKPISNIIVDELMQLTLTMDVGGADLKGTHRNKNIKNRKDSNTTTNLQLGKIISIMKEVEGESRSALFYAFLQAMKEEG